MRGVSGRGENVQKEEEEGELTVGGGSVGGGAVEGGKNRSRRGKLLGEKDVVGMRRRKG